MVLWGLVVGPVFHHHQIVCNCALSSRVDALTEPFVEVLRGGRDRKNLLHLNVLPLVGVTVTELPVEEAASLAWIRPRDMGEGCCC